MEGDSSKFKSLPPTKSKRKRKLSQGPASSSVSSWDPSAAVVQSSPAQYKAAAPKSQQRSRRASNTSSVEGLASNEAGPSVLPSQRFIANLPSASTDVAGVASSWSNKHRKKADKKKRKRLSDALTSPVLPATTSSLQTAEAVDDEMDADNYLEPPAPAGFAPNIDVKGKGRAVDVEQKEDVNDEEVERPAKKQKRSKKTKMKKTIRESTAPDLSTASASIMEAAPELQLKQSSSDESHVEEVKVMEIPALMPSVSSQETSLPQLQSASLNTDASGSIAPINRTVIDLNDAYSVTKNLIVGNKDLLQVQPSAPKATPDVLTQLAERREREKLREEVNNAKSEVETVKKQLSVKDEMLSNHESSFRKLSNALTCQICLEILNRPFITLCGHTHCYECLLNWFSNPPVDPGAALLPPTRRVKTCPTCRTVVLTPPAENFLVKTLVHSFKIELELEQTMEPKDAGDKAFAWEGLFRKPGEPERNAPIRDDDDGIYRCGECGFELVNGLCTGCGAAYLSDIGDSAAGSNLDENSAFGEVHVLVGSSDDEERSAGHDVQSEDEDDDDEVGSLADFIDDDQDVAPVNRNLVKVIGRGATQEMYEDFKLHAHDDHNTARIPLNPGSSLPGGEIAVEDQTYDVRLPRRLQFDELMDPRGHSYLRRQLRRNHLNWWTRVRTSRRRSAQIPIVLNDVLSDDSDAESDLDNDENHNNDHEGENDDSDGADVGNLRRMREDVRAQLRPSQRLRRRYAEDSGDDDGSGSEGSHNDATGDEDSEESTESVRERELYGDDGMSHRRPTPSSRLTRHHGPTERVSRYWAQQQPRQQQVSGSRSTSTSALPSAPGPSASIRSSRRRIVIEDSDDE